MARDKVQERKEEAASTHMSDEEASAFADNQQKASKKGADAAKAFEKAVEDARKAGLVVSGSFSYVENNVSFNRTV